MKEENIPQNPELPLVINAKWMYKLIAFLVMLIGSLLLTFVLFGIFDSFSSKNLLILGLLILFFGFLIGFVFLWPIWISSSIKCTEDEIEFSALSIIYSRIKWDDITKVEEKIIAYGKNGPKHNFYIYHKGAFLRLASGISVGSYKEGDFKNIRSVVQQKAYRVFAI